MQHILLIIAYYIEYVRTNKPKKWQACTINILCTNPFSNAQNPLFESAEK